MLMSTRPTASLALIRESEKRHVAVSVPFAKLGLTRCPEVNAALERFYIVCDESFPSQHSKDIIPKMITTSHRCEL